MRGLLGRVIGSQEGARTDEGRSETTEACLTSAAEWIVGRSSSVPVNGLECDRHGQQGMSGGPLDLKGLPPIVDSKARVLVLGSMPGSRSLKLCQYYVGRGNRFWRLAADLVSLDLSQPYDARVQHLVSRGVALWDVLASCRRKGALDSAIERGSEVANDFASFFRVHPMVRVVALNGKVAAVAFQNLVMRGLPEDLKLRVLDLPSTSAANAAWPYDRLREQWSVALCSATLT